MLAPTATARLRVGGGVPDAPSNARALRADMESAPTAYTKISIGPYKVGNRVYLAPEGSNGEEAKSVKNRAALLHGLAFCFLDLPFGVPRGEQPLGRASRAIGSSGHFFGSFLVSKRNT